MKKFKLLLLLFFGVFQSSFAQLKTYTFEEVEQLSKVSPKPIVVFIQTSWCNYCKMMENTTLKNSEITTTLNNNFYFIAFDAESKNDITFNEHVFKFRPSGNTTGIHELAIQLGTIAKQISYPTLCVLNYKYEIVFQNNSFMNSKDFKIILTKFFNE